MTAKEIKPLMTVMAVFVVASWNTAASQSHLWSKSMSGPYHQRGSCVAVHGTDVVVTGWFEDTVDLGGGPLTSVGGTDIYFAKYDANGTHLISRRFGGVDYESAVGIAVDGAGNILIAGAFEGTIELGGGPLTSAGNDDIFVAKYDPSGAHVWSRRFGDTGYDGGGPIAADHAGNVLVTGSFEGSVDFGGGPLVTSGAVDIFFAKYDPNGSHVWSRSVGGIHSEGGGAITTDGSDNVIASGYFRGTADFGGRPMTSAGEGDVFLVKYDPNGTHVWSRALGGPSIDEGKGIAVADAGDILLTGFFRGAVDFGGGALAADSIFGDVFLARYAGSSGAHVWSKSFGGASSQTGRAVAVDGDDNVLITGDFQGSVDFGGGALTSPSNADIFLAKYDGNGVHQWSQQFGSVSFPDFGASVAADDNEDVLITGRFNGTADFGGGPFTATGTDGYLAKYAGVTAVGISDTPLPDRTALGSHPNPFTSSTLIEFFLPRDESVKLLIYDAKGRHVRTLLESRMNAGWHFEEWNGRDGRGRQVATGVYFYRLVVGSSVQAKKTVLVR
jgi:hypothetical protein